MATTAAIQAKFEELKAKGIDLGGEQGPEQVAHSGGKVQVYQSGRIYWHPNIGAREVHGGILLKYLSLGGPGVNPTTGRRDFGYPTSDEVHTRDGLYPVSHFEFGSIIWGPAGTDGGTGIWGEFRTAWETMNGMSRQSNLWGWELARLGYPISEPSRMTLPQFGEVAYFQKGCLWRGPVTNNVVAISELGDPLPRMCRPTIVDPAGSLSQRLGGLIARLHVSIPKAVFDANPGPVRGFFDDLWGGLFLRQVTKPGEPRPEIRILGELGGDEQVSAQAVLITERLQLADGGPAGPTPLKDRALYDVVLRLPTGKTYVMAPHAYYVKKAWDNFGFVHATDLHVSRRLDGFQRRLTELRLAGASEFSNCNDNFRSLVSYANSLHDAGVVDFLLATGDLVDYVFEDNDNRLAGGNFRFLEQLILGQSHFTTGRKAEELRMPIFTTLGNHDYRPNAYTMDFEIVVAPVLLPDEHIESVRNSEGFNLTADEAKALQGDRVPTLNLVSSDGPDRFLRMATPDVLNRKGTLNYYFTNLVAMDRNATRSQYTVELGPHHRIVMLDSGPDLGVPADADFSTLVSLLKEYIFGMSESRRLLLGGGPNVGGFTPGHLSEIAGAIRHAHNPGGPDPQGLVIVGVHAPPLNPAHSELPHYFRETEHPTAPPEEMFGYIVRSGEIFHAANPEALGWERTGTAHFKRGSVAELLDHGIAKGRADDFLKLCVGQGGAQVGKKVDLVLCGHHHDRAEFRLGWDSGRQQILYHMDFYTENPGEYYRSQKRGFDKVHINVKSGAPPNGPVAPARDPDPGAFWKEWKALDVPPRTLPLNAVADPKAWWERHRPLVLQTGPLGPIDQNLRKDTKVNPIKPGPNFQGIRVIFVQKNAISSINYVTRADFNDATTMAKLREEKSVAT